MRGGLCGGHKLIGDIAGGERGTLGQLKVCRRKGRGQGVSRRPAKCLRHDQRIQPVRSNVCTSQLSGPEMVTARGDLPLQT